MIFGNEVNHDFTYKNILDSNFMQIIFFWSDINNNEQGGVEVTL